MKHSALFVLATLALTACGGSNPSATSPTPVSEPAYKAPGDATVGDKTKCPVSGENFVVNASSPKTEYKGKTYYFCCGGCDKKFTTDPEKYLHADTSAHH